MDRNYAILSEIRQNNEEVKDVVDNQAMKLEEHSSIYENVKTTVDAMDVSIAIIQNILGENFRVTFPNFEIDETSVRLLEKVVESEAQDQGLWGKFLVANVVLNRCAADRFPKTIEQVIYQHNQFEVVQNGRIDSVTVTEETKEAVQLALVYSYTDALFFYSSKVDIGETNERFFNSLEKLFEYKDHVFLRYN